MALIDLGTIDISLEDEWVSFNGIGLEDGKSYPVFIETNSSSPSQVYSYFAIRAEFELIDNPSGVQAVQTRFYYESDQQFLVFDFPKGANKDVDVVFQVRRFSYYHKVTMLADVSITLRVNDKELG